MAVLPLDLISADLKDSPYPTGPYAQADNANLGYVLPDLTFQSYWSPNTVMGQSSAQPFGEIADRFADVMSTQQIVALPLAPAP